MSLRIPNLKKIFFLLVVVMLFLTVKHFDYSEDQQKVKRWAEEGRSETPEPGLFKVFHLDLKGGPPKLSFLLKALPVIRSAGANAILIEYEDMFPFEGALRNVSAENAYSLTEVQRILKLADSLGMEVIPLVQTFGHLEYVLKLEEFENLRELESFPQEICPLNKDAVDLVKEMIRQVMAVHDKSKYIHIGCDEVRHMGACARCSRTNPKLLFSKHVTRIADHVKSHYPGVTPLIWDDMLRRWTFHDLANSGLGSSVEPVVWVYGNNILTLVPPFTWNIYQRTFSKLWAASAFKGAFGETEILPDLVRHLENHLSWREFLFGEDAPIKRNLFSGIFVTGWSRYDHFAVLCELLPVSIPSLVLDLVFLDPKFKEIRNEGLSKWLGILQCPSDFLPGEGKDETFFREKLSNCSFPGANLYSGVAQLQKLKSRVKTVTEKADTSGWTSDYNVKKNFTSPWRLLEMFPEEGFAGEVLRKDLLLWKLSFLPVMNQYFDKHTVAEWEEQNIKPLEDKLLQIQKNFQKMLQRRVWPRRPLR